MRVVLSAALILAIFLCNAESSKILAIFSSASKSNFLVVKPLLLELAKRGHKITSVSAFPFENQVPNIRDVYLDGFENRVPEWYKAYVPKSKNIPIVSYMLLTVDIVQQYTEHCFGHPEFLRLLKSNETFDLIIINSFMNDALYGLSHVFKAPTISICPRGPSYHSDAITGYIPPYSYVPTITSEFTEQMTFLERAENTINNIVWLLGERLLSFPAQNAIYREHIKDGPPLKDLVLNTSLVFVSSNIALDYARPFLPNVVQIGGMHLKEAENLPDDIQKFMDEAEHGVIYLSFGTFFKNSHFETSKLKILQKVLFGCPLRVLWAGEDTDMPYKPANVKTAKWFPQEDILAHPKLRVFITHGGLGSTVEASFAGVPILGIPFLANNFLHVEKAVYHGYGIRIYIDEMTEESFKNDLHEILQNPKYMENAKKRSELLRDQPMKPLDVAVYWTEYVLRHKGAPHLSSASKNLNAIQYLLLDVFAFFIVIISAILLLVSYLIKKILKGFQKIDKKKTE